MKKLKNTTNATLKKAKKKEPMKDSVSSYSLELANSDLSTHIFHILDNEEKSTVLIKFSNFYNHDEARSFINTIKEHDNFHEIHNDETNTIH